MDPLITAAMVTAGAGLFGDLFSTNSTNKQNRALMREQMAWSEKESAKQRDFTREMQAHTEAYNDPAAQFQRLKNVGLNPYLLSGSNMVDSGNVGMAATPAVPSAPSATMMQKADFSPLTQFSGQLTNILLSKSQAKKNESESYSKVLENAGTIYKMFGKKGFDRYVGNALAQMKDTDFESSLMFRQMTAEVELQEVQKDLQAYELKLNQQYKPQQLQAVIDNLQQDYVESTARVGKMAADVKNRERELDILAKETASKIALNAAQVLHLNADTTTINEIRQYLVGQAKYKMAQDKADAVVRKADAYDRYSKFKQGKKRRAFEQSDAGQDFEYYNSQLIKYLETVELGTRAGKNFSSSVSDYSNVVSPAHAPARAAAKRTARP